MSGFLMSALPSLKDKQPFYSLSYRQAEQWFKRFKRLKSHEGKYASVRSFLLKHGHKISRPAHLFETFERQLAQVGVFSVSECPDNPLMWAHYAANHEGLVIGFRRVAGSRLESGQHLLRITYQKTKPTFTTGFVNQISFMQDAKGNLVSGQKIGFSDPTFRAALATKPVEWSYEEEWRYVEEVSGLYPWPGPVDTIVFGLRMPTHRPAHYAQLVAAAVSHPVSFFEIARSEENTELTLIPWRGGSSASAAQSKV